MTLLKKYRFFAITTVVLVIILILNREIGMKAVGTIGYSMKEMLLIMPPIFVLLGLLDVWVPKEIMMRYMGEKSGLKGIVLALFLGSAAAGPLYGAFPVAAVFMKKGVKFSNVLIFIGAWSTTKIPLVLFEISTLGASFAVTRLLVDIPGVILIAFILNSLIDKAEVKRIYDRAELM